MLIIAALRDPGWLGGSPTGASRLDSASLGPSRSGCNALPPTAGLPPYVSVNVFAEFVANPMNPPRVRELIHGSIHRSWSGQDFTSIYRAVRSLNR